MNPFAYPKSKHVRLYAPKQYRRYQTYKRVLRLEFQGKCVYCRFPVTLKGSEGFGVDHYRPVKKFPHLSCSYQNLFYCCNTCNSHKNQYWPDTPKNELTHYIPNPCDYVMFDHLRFAGARVIPRSTAGIVAEEILDLNDPDSVEFRAFIIDTIGAWSEKQSVLLNMKKAVLKRDKKSSADAQSAAQAITEIDSQLAVADRNLKRLGGPV